MKKDKPRISVIIPVYNAEAYLERCYFSLNKQTYENLELVFVNDGSTDDSLAYLQSVQKKDPRVVIIDVPCNQGVSAARNAGLANCTGEYIGFCDADDICEPSMFATMLSSILSNDAEMSCCSIRRVRNDTTVLEVLWEAPVDYLMKSEEAMANWLIGNYIGNSVCTKLTKRELWDNVSFPENEIFEEAAVIPILISRANKIVHTGTVEYNYVARSDSITAKPADKRLFSIFKREEEIREYVLSIYPHLEQEVTFFEVRQNIGAMISAEVSRKVMDTTVYSEIKKQFDRIFVAGIKNKYTSMKVFLKLIELKSGLFYYRKVIQKQILA